MFTACGDKNQEDEATAEPIQTTESTPTPEATPTPPPVETPTPVPTPVPVESPSAGASESSGSGSTRVLKIEDDGDDVTELQERLEELGYLDTVTGYFGTDTEAAVKKFQRNNDLDDDGVVGGGTRSVLFSGDAVEA
jgi:peptidoglycan hydrolase-like protein with peptidoglycan-binding domain